MINREIQGGGSNPQNFGLSEVKLSKFAESGGSGDPPCHPLPAPMTDAKHVGIEKLSISLTNTAAIGLTQY